MNSSFEKIPPVNADKKWWRWFYDERVLQIITQVAFAFLVITIGVLLYRNMVQTLAKQGLNLGFGFLNQISGFDISIKPIPHFRISSNWRAIQVGILNTIIASLLSIVISTILGIIIGIMRVSKNLLLNRISWLYIEIFRNIPLLLVIIASYAVFVFNLPNVQDSIVLPGPSYISNRGLYIPKPIPTETTNLFLLALLASLMLIVFGTVKIVKIKKWDNFIGFTIASGALLIFSVIIYFLLPTPPFLFEIPAKIGLNFTGGISFPPEFLGIVLGLVMGSAPFTADTVRSGLQAVSSGQIEASRALGMSNYQTLRFVIFPQAMRVIVPPMTSNYLSLTKNSSLASAIAFPEIVHISSTITSQTGRSVEIMIIIMMIYGTLSLLTSLFMNWFNKRVKLVE